MRLFRKKKVYDDQVSPNDTRTVELLALHNITTVFDIGANIGQYARRLRAAGYAGKIVSFEPLSQNHATLTTLCTNDKNWIIAPRMAIGHETGEVTMNISEHHDMSSALSLEQTALTALPKSRVITTETAPLKKLDDVVDEFAPASGGLFVKVDTQGFEMNVLNGAANAIAQKKIAGWQLELSLLPLYQGEKTFEDIVVWLKSMGYSAHLIIPGYFSKKLNRQLQIDGVFFKD